MIGDGGRGPKYSDTKQKDGARSNDLDVQRVGLFATPQLRHHTVPEFDSRPKATASIVALEVLRTILIPNKEAKKLIEHHTWDPRNGTGKSRLTLIRQAVF